jgi:hypothetical protein
MKHSRLLFLSCVGLSLFSFEKNHLKNQTYTNPKLIGHWQINEIIIDNVKYDINKFPNCENKENVEFKDSTYKWETYVFRKNHCFRNVMADQYKMNMGYDYENKKTVPMLAANRTYIIITVNDTMLKIKEQHGNILKSYKKIK